MKNIKTVIFIAIMVLGVAILLPSGDVAAQVSSQEIKKGVDEVGGGGAMSFDNALKYIVNTLLFLIGAVSVVMIIYGGFRYVTSGGDASAVKSAKDTILYAVVGIVVALLAWAIADFVVNTVSGTNDEGSDGGVVETRSVNPSDSSTPVQSGQPVRSGSDR